MLSFLLAAHYIHLRLHIYSSFIHYHHKSPPYSLSQNPFSMSLLVNGSNGCVAALYVCSSISCVTAQITGVCLFFPARLCSIIHHSLSIHPSFPFLSFFVLHRPCKTTLAATTAAITIVLAYLRVHLRLVHSGTDLSRCGFECMYFCVAIT